MMQGQVAYTWEPSPRLEQISLQVQKVLRNMRLATFGLYHTVTDQNFGVKAAITRSFGHYACSINADLSFRQACY